MKTKEITLNNGIKVILINYPGAKMISTNVFIGAGARYETKETYGLSHFLEHMVFKGTEKYPSALEFAKTIESVGGLLNAWTAEDHTSYWNMVPTEHSNLSFNMLAEQVAKPLLLENEIEMERGVVIEEIRRSQDDPFLFIIHKLNSVLWPDHPMECDVLGPEKNIKKISRKDFVSYMNQYYVSENIIISVAGDFDDKKIIEELENNFSIVKSGKKKKPKKMDLKQKEPTLKTFAKELNQSHAILAYKTPGYENEKKYANKVLATILGGGMSSRLFEEIREKRGLAYTVRSGIDTFTDTGYFYVYGGFNLDKTHDALNAIKEVLNESKSVIYKEEIKKAKEYLKGTSYYALDGIEKVSAWYGQRMMFTPKEIDPDEIIRKIERVTPEDVRVAARELIRRENENLLILSPYKNKEKFAKILSH